MVTPYLFVDLAGAWGGLMVFDSVIFTLTLYKAIGVWKLGTRRLTHVILRDGKYLSYVVHWSVASDRVRY